MFQNVTQYQSDQHEEKTFKGKKHIHTHIHTHVLSTVGKTR